MIACHRPPHPPPVANAPLSVVTLQMLVFSAGDAEARPADDDLLPGRSKPCVTLSLCWRTPRASQPSQGMTLRGSTRGGGRHTMVRVHNLGANQRLRDPQGPGEDYNVSSVWREFFIVNMHILAQLSSVSESALRNRACTIPQSDQTHNNLTLRSLVGFVKSNWGIFIRQRHRGSSLAKGGVP